jgi:hypothetical protein
MSALLQSLAPHFAAAQALLGETVLYRMHAYTGTFGQPRVEEQMLAAGGYRRRTVLPLTLTRAQFAAGAAPVPKEKLTRPGLQETYLIDLVDTSDPLHYVLTLIKL